MSKSKNPNVNSYNPKYECFITNGAAFLLGLIVSPVLIVAASLITASDLSVKALNKSGSDLEYLELVFPEYSVTIPGANLDGIERSDFVTIYIGDRTDYIVKAQIIDGPLVVSDSRAVDPGCTVYEVIYVDRINHVVRSCF